MVKSIGLYPRHATWIPPQKKKGLETVSPASNVWLFSISMLNFGGVYPKFRSKFFCCNEHITYGMKIHEPLLLVIGITCRFIPSCSSCSQRKWLKMASPGLARIGLALLIRRSLQKKTNNAPPLSSRSYARTISTFYRE